MVIQTLTGKDSFLGVAALGGSCRDIPTDSNSFVLSSQLPGRLFSPSEISKNFTNTFYNIFQLVWVPMTTIKYQDVFLNLLCRKYFFTRFSPLDKENLNEFKGGTLMKMIKNICYLSW